MKKRSKIDFLDEKSEPVQEVLSSTPGWITYWGATTIFLTIICFFFISWMIKYPDVVSAQAVITTPNPPARIFSKSTGIISEIYVKENNTVKSGDILGVIENNANYLDVINLESIVKGFNYKSPKDTSFIDGNFMLGEIQNDYLNFINSLHDYYFLCHNNPFNKEIDLLKKEISYYNKLGESSDKRISIGMQEVSLAKKELNRSKHLLEQKAIAKTNYESAEIAYLNELSRFEGIKESKISNDLKIISLKKNILSLENKNLDMFDQTSTKIETATKKLLNSINHWKSKFLLIATINGKATFSKNLAKNQLVTIDEDVLTIIPSEKQEIIAKVKMPVKNSGKVNTGQKVNIYLNNYPYQEYGIINGNVESISQVPSQDYYLILVSLPEGLKTNSTTLTFKQELQGEAEIITEDIRLIERFFFQLRTLFKDA